MEALPHLEQNQCHEVTKDMDVSTESRQRQYHDPAMSAPQWFERLLLIRFFDECG